MKIILASTLVCFNIYIAVLHASNQNNFGENEISTEGYVRWDIGAKYSLKFNSSRVLLYVKGRNLGDEATRLSTSFLRGFAPDAG